MSEEPKLEELDRLISMGKQKGFLTYDEVNDALPSDIVSLDQLDDIMMMFGAMDIEVVDSAKAGSTAFTPRRVRCGIFSMNPP
jgi:RNA polymerase primary sigma factor